MATGDYQHGFAVVRSNGTDKNSGWKDKIVCTVSGIEYGGLSKFLDFARFPVVVKLKVAVAASLDFSPAPPKGVRDEGEKLDNDGRLECCLA